MNTILVLRDTVDLKTPFPISSPDHTAPEMTASILGMFVLPLSDGSTCDIPMYYFTSLADTIVSRLSRIVDTMDNVSSTCRGDVAFSYRIRMIIIHPSFL
jgi:hypothetical protein